jgi:dipeptidyl aminopeptidase/acylaminoacyl peptidase
MSLNARMTRGEKHMMSKRIKVGIIPLLTCMACFVTTGNLAKAQGPMALSVEDAVGGRTFGQLMPMTLSRRGEWLAFTVKDNRRAENGNMETWARTGVRSIFTGTDVWISNIETGETRNLTGNKGANFLPVWSPDGHFLAFLSDRDGSGQAKLWVWDAVKNEQKRVSDVDVRAEQIAWTLDSRRILVTTLPQELSLEEYVSKRVTGAESQKPNGNEPQGASVVLYTATIANLQDHEETPRSDPWNLNWTLRDLMLIDVSSGKGIVIVRSQKILRFLLSPDGLRVAYTNQKRFEKAGSQQILFDLATVSLSTAAERIVAPNIPLGFTGEFSWSPHGTQLAYLVSGPTERTNDCYVVDVDGGNRRNLTSFTPREWRRHSEIPLWDSQGKQIYFVRDGALWRVSVAQSEVVQVARVPDRQIVKLISQSEGHLWTLEGGKSTVVLTHDDLGKQDGFYKIELQSGKTTLLLEKGQCYTCTNVNEGQSTAVTGDENYVVYYAENAAHDSDLWIGDASFQNPRRLTHLNAQLDKYRMGAARLVEWLSDDGERLQGALLLPVGYQEGKRYPLIVWVYGGGSLSNHFGHFGFEGPGVFNMQLLSTRGYAVLCPDSPQHLGTPLLDLAKTVLPSVNKIIEMGIADPDRLGVMGQSNGGYSTLALIGETKRFKAAVEMDGMGNLLGAYGSMDGSGAAFETSNLENGQNALGGTPWQVRDRYIENSPVFYLDRVETPLLVVHGSRDPVVAPFLGDEVFVGLRRLGKQVEYAKYQGEEHSPLYWTYANQVDLCNRMIAWFEKYLAKENPRNSHREASR